eukprot:gene12871-biopygen8909
MNAIRSLEASAAAAQSKVEAKFAEASVVVTDLKSAIDTR